MFISLLLSAVLSPDELYLKALVRLQSLPQSPYIEYRMKQSSSATDGTNRFSLDELVIERRADHISWNSVQGGDSFPLNHVLIGQHYIVPDMFLHSGDITAAPGTMPQLDKLDDETLKVIVTVKAVPKPQYTVSRNGDVTREADATLPGCGDVVHLMLKPKGDSDRYNVRELWIRPT